MYEFYEKNLSEYFKEHPGEYILIEQDNHFDFKVNFFKSKGGLEKAVSKYTRLISSTKKAIKRWRGRMNKKVRIGSASRELTGDKKIYSGPSLKEEGNLFEIVSNAFLYPLESSKKKKYVKPTMVKYEPLIGILPF